MALHQARLDSLLPDNLLLGFIKHDLLMSPATLVGTLFGVPFFCVHHHGTKCCVTASSLHKDSRVGLTARPSERCIRGSFRTWIYLSNNLTVVTYKHALIRVAKQLEQVSRFK